MAKKEVIQDVSWEVKDRTYLLTGNNKPLTLKIPSRHNTRHALLHYDESNNTQREIRYATNQNSPFKEEQGGEATLGHIVFKEGHLFILETPLFRVRNKKQTFYCYSDEEKREAIEKLRGKPEITRFKGLGEISPNEFVHFIGDDIRLDPVMLDKEMSIEQMLQFYMGKNTPDRQKFIIDNLKVELDTIEDTSLS